jgi:hypothetical protein
MRRYLKVPFFLWPFWLQACAALSLLVIVFSGCLTILRGDLQLLASASDNLVRARANLDKVETRKVTLTSPDFTGNFPPRAKIGLVLQQLGRSALENSVRVSSLQL